MLVKNVSIKFNFMQNKNKTLKLGRTDSSGFGTRSHWKQKSGKILYSTKSIASKHREKNSLLSSWFRRGEASLF